MSRKKVGVRELKARLSEFLQMVQEGEILEVSSRGVVIARVIPVSSKNRTKPLDLVKQGFANWNGTKLRVKMPTTRLKAGKMASDLVLEDRD